MITPLTLTPGRRPDGTPVLAAAGEIDVGNADAFAAALGEAVAAAVGAALFVDLTAVEYIDSAGLAALFAHADRIQLVASPLLTTVLTVCGLADLTTIHSASGPGER